jgi:hypothetical protein
MQFSQASSDNEDVEVLRNRNVNGQDSEEEELEEEDDQIFSCRIGNSKIVADILSAIHAGGKDHICEVKASARALVFSVVGRGKSTQARATLQADIFEEYIFESGSSSHPGSRRRNATDSSSRSGSESVMHFSINLTTLLDCLQLFGSTSETTAATLTFSVSD